MLTRYIQQCFTCQTSKKLLKIWKLTLIYFFFFNAQNSFYDINVEYLPSWVVWSGEPNNKLFDCRKSIMPKVFIITTFDHLRLDKRIWACAKLLFDKHIVSAQFNWQIKKWLVMIFLDWLLKNKAQISKTTMPYTQYRGFI